MNFFTGFLVQFCTHSEHNLKHFISLDVDSLRTFFGTRIAQVYLCKQILTTALYVVPQLCVQRERQNLVCCKFPKLQTSRINIQRRCKECASRCCEQSFTDLVISQFCASTDAEVGMAPKFRQKEDLLIRTKPFSTRLRYLQAWCMHP